MSDTPKKEIPPDKLVRVTFMPEGKTVEFEFGTMPYEHHGKPMSFLDVAENFGVFLDHACGGVCACTTCHLWIKDQEGISQADDDELDRMDMAADQQLNSRLGCQAVITKPGNYVVEIPKWNRNYTSEGKPLAMAEGSSSSRASGLDLRHGIANCQIHIVINERGNDAARNHVDRLRGDRHSIAGEVSRHRSAHGALHGSAQIRD